MSSTASDTLVLDFEAAARLAAALADAATALQLDQVALEPMLDDATAITRRDQFGAVPSIASARYRLDTLATDLRIRLAWLEATRADMGRIDELTAALDEWGGDVGGRSRPRVAALTARRHELILRLVGGDERLAVRVEAAIGRGLDVGEALVAVDEQVQTELRVAAVADELGLDLATAGRVVARIERTVARLVDLGYPREDAAAVVALVEQFDLDLAEVVQRVAERGVGLIEAAGELLTARALGILPSEFDALGGLEEHFAVFDNATGGRADGRVSAEDLRYVVDHQWRFTSGQVAAAEALLAAPSLRNRLDTANENDEILDATWFGRTEPGDGLIAEADLRAFLLKAQLNHLLGPYADRIDIAADSSGIVDGYLSQNDLRRFLADNPELPESVVAAAEVMLANGWFDESWWQAHKDELALGAAVLAGGIVVVGTGGAASVVLVAGAGALAAGGTTIAVNLATGDDLLDDVLGNSFTGLFVGAGVHAAVAGASAYGTASTALARSAALAGATAGATDVVALGGIDLLVPESDEARVHDVAGKVSWVASGWEMSSASVDGWITTRMARFETLDDQLDALSPTISRQRQGRHIEGALERTEGHGGYFTDPADAQAVLDAVHDGSGEILGRTRAGDILVRVEGIEGINHNPGSLNPYQHTDVFLVKGTASPSVVPTSPLVTPADPTSRPRTGE